MSSTELPGTAAPDATVGSAEMCRVRLAVPTDRECTATPERDLVAELTPPPGLGQPLPDLAREKGLPIPSRNCCPWAKPTRAAVTVEDGLAPLPRDGTFTDAARSFRYERISQVIVDETCEPPSTRRPTVPPLGFPFLSPF